MARLPIVLDHFNRGVIADEVLGRVSSDWYLHALRKCKNGVITPYGNIRKRSGTKYIANIEGNQFRLIPFIYSETEAYVLLFVIDHNYIQNDNRIYFLTLDGYVVDANNNPYYIELTYDNTIDLSRIQYVQKDDILYLVYKGKPVKKITRLAENNWTIEDVNFDLKYILAYGNGVSAVVEGVLPVSLVEPLKVELHWSFNGQEYVSVDDGQGNFPDPNFSTATIDYNTGRIYIKMAKNIPSQLYAWKSNTSYEVGDYVLASNGCVYKATTSGTSGTAEPQWTWVLGSTVTDNQVVWECELVPFDSNTPIYVRFLNEDSFQPGCVTFFENRLIVANFPDNPQAIAGSVTGSYESFVFGTDDNNAFIYEIASKENNEITWLYGGNILFVGTVGAEYVATGSSTGITPKSISIVKQSEYGSTFIQPVEIGYSMVFVQTHRTRLYDFTYQYNINGYIGSDLNIINYDIVSNKIKELSVEKQPYVRLWVLLEDGNVAILTYMKDQGIMAWQTFEPEGKVKTIATIPAIIDNYSKTYMVIDRNGKYYIESTQNLEWNTYYDTVFADCSVIYSGVPTSSINVPYPDGTNVVIFTKEGVHRPTTVLSGVVNLDWQTTWAVVGFPYTYEVNTVPIELVSQGQLVSFNKPKALKDIRLFLDKSMGGYVGVNNNYWLIFREVGDLMGVLPSIYSGVKAVWLYDIQSSIDQFYIGIKHDQPLPFNLLAIAVDVEVGQV